LLHTQSNQSGICGRRSGTERGYIRLLRSDTWAAFHHCSVQHRRYIALPSVVARLKGNRTHIAHAFPSKNILLLIDASHVFVSYTCWFGEIIVA
jgi:hypothetical protein